MVHTSGSTYRLAICQHKATPIVFDTLLHNTTNFDDNRDDVPMHLEATEKSYEQETMKILQ